MKQTITIQLNTSEIIYDIQNKTFLTGRSLGGNSNPSHVANMQANDDDENAAQILRSITTAFSILRNRLAEYQTATDNLATNESFTDSDNLLLNLEMPSNFNASVTKSIGALAHQFVVAAAIADWFAITAKGETSDYASVAESSLTLLDQTLSKRCRPTRNS